MSPLIGRCFHFIYFAYNFLSKLSTLKHWCMKWSEVKWKSLSHVWLFATPWTIQNTGVVAFPFSRGSSQPRDQTQVSHIAGGFFTSWTRREALSLLADFIIFSTILPFHCDALCLHMDSFLYYFYNMWASWIWTHIFLLFIENSLSLNLLVFPALHIFHMLCILFSHIYLLFNSW